MVDATFPPVASLYLGSAVASSSPPGLGRSDIWQVWAEGTREYGATTGDRSFLPVPSVRLGKAVLARAKTGAQRARLARFVSFFEKLCAEYRKPIHGPSRSQRRDIKNYKGK